MVIDEAFKRLVRVLLAALTLTFELIAGGGAGWVNVLNAAADDEDE